MHGTTPAALLMSSTYFITVAFVSSPEVILSATCTDHFPSPPYSCAVLSRHYTWRRGPKRICEETKNTDESCRVSLGQNKLRIPGN